ncbi:RhuM family protein [Wolbachia endosymbiont of Listronotus oregonensis]|uniref:RhuM family protein n=1 Tax=Wolbachia endosymbiont of Listronotus oregonensis TaxID=2969106 RepID=UPI002815549E|nr:RhuM family protein [Wolbachia endosymbiont of Listronotus oregonensis]
MQQSSRVDHKKPNIGLTTWKDGSGNKIHKSDVSTAKNYLTEKELSAYCFLDYAELQARKHRLMKMQNWVEKLDAFLLFNDYEVLKDAGKVSAEVAKALAEGEYEKYRVIQT